MLLARRDLLQKLKLKTYLNSSEQSLDLNTPSNNPFIELFSKESFCLNKMLKKAAP